MSEGWCIGRKSYTTTMMRDTSNKRHSVANAEVQQKISEGWILCGHSLPRKNRSIKMDFETHRFDRNNFITVHNVELKKQMRIHPDDLDAFIQHGWRRGRGFVHMRRGDERKQVYVWEMDEYLSEGWTR